MKKYVIGILMAITLVVGVVNLGGHAYAASTDSAKAEVCAGVSGTTSGNCGTGGVSLNKTLKGILNLLSVVAGIVAVIMIVISGMRYITSGGEAQAVSGAKRGLIYTIVGLVVVALSQIIVHFILAHTV